MRKYVEEELRRMEAAAVARGEPLRPEDVVKAAEDPANPLHEEFEWDETAAARNYRLHQARQLISGVQIEIRTTTYPIKARAYVHDPSLPPGEQGYISALRIRSQEERARLALQAELDRVHALATRARQVALTLDLEAEVEDRLREILMLGPQ